MRAIESACESVLPTSAKLVGSRIPYSTQIRCRSASASPERIPPSGRQWYAYSLRRLQENPKIAGYIAADTVGRLLPGRNGST